MAELLITSNPGPDSLPGSAASAGADAHGPLALGPSPQLPPLSPARVSGAGQALGQTHTAGQGCSALKRSSAGRRICVFGVWITDMPRADARELLAAALRSPSHRPRTVFFANAHTLNLAAASEEYRRVLNQADWVFGDGTGLRWAARLRGVRLWDNLCGTDLIPQLFAACANRGLRYFLLGGDRQTVARAATGCPANRAGWTLAGCHHGYLASPRLCDQAVEAINRARPDLLLVGMGNPLQETWIHAHRHKLEVPLVAAVGGLFHYWAGTLRRASPWLRRWGAEWLGILWQQPHKARRYLLGNPLFLWRAFSWLHADRVAMHAAGRRVARGDSHRPVTVGSRDWRK